MACLHRNGFAKVLVIGGRYGLADKPFTPSMSKAVFDHLKSHKPFHNFSVGITDDVSLLSLKIKDKLDLVPAGTKQCIFWAIGSDGTVGANKESIKIIGDNLNNFYAQATFLYSAHKAGGATLCQLRFGPSKITSQYPIQEADFVACHKSTFVSQFNVVKNIKKEGIFVLNSPWETEEEIEQNIPANIKKIIAERNVKFYNVNAEKVAREAGLGQRINLVMQTVFFTLTYVFPEEKSKRLLKDVATKNYSKKGKEILEANHSAIDNALKNLKRINYNKNEWLHLEDDTELLIKHKLETKPNLDEFITKIQMPMIQRRGGEIPVSKFVPGGISPPSTAKEEKRGIGLNVPVWKPDQCIQCNLCSFMCPHSVIRPFIFTEDEIKNAPETLKHIPLRPPTEKGVEMDKNLAYSIQVSPYDCTGCTVCVTSCKSNALGMKPTIEHQDRMSKEWDYSASIPLKEWKETKMTVKKSQFLQPLFEFNGACVGCGQTAYLKLISQLYGDRMVLAGATGCSSVYCSSYIANPFTVTQDSRKWGIAYARSLFENGAEFGYGMLISNLQRRDYLRMKVKELLLRQNLPKNLSTLLFQWDDNFRDGEKTKFLAANIINIIEEYCYENEGDPLIKEIYGFRDLFLKPSQWIMGGDGWAYDIGFSGLDHILSTGKDLNIIVLDNENYANTGGQRSKATQMGSVTKFGGDGKRQFKKDLGLMAMTYGNVFVGSIALSAKPAHALKTIQEAESFNGPSLILCYTPCIEFNIVGGLGEGQKQAETLAVETGYWPIYKYDPRLKQQGLNPLILDKKEPSRPLEDLLNTEIRFKSLKENMPEVAEKLKNELQEELKNRLKKYDELSQLKYF
jgi:pyruvate-ferredoxin/flavodoxin oxidoreductase